MEKNGYMSGKDYVTATTKQEFALQVVSTKAIFFKIFNTFEEAFEFKMNRPNPDNWNIVCRTVNFSNWEKIKED